MKTLILPGYSAHNRDWALEIARELEAAEVHEWAHWKTGGRMDPTQELKAILGKITGRRVNLLAKSVGCRMAARSILQNPAAVEKAVFCGIPSTDRESVEDMQRVAAVMPAGRILVVQNTADPYTPFETIEEIFREINPAIPVQERPRDDHHYPYPEDFKAFLEDAG